MTRRPLIAAAALLYACLSAMPADATARNSAPNAAAAKAFQTFAAARASATEKRLCGLIERAAARSAVPVGFFTRLLW